MNKTINLICIGCPMGCPLTVLMQGDTVVSVAGNTCKRGDDYARREVVSPMRVFSTTLPVLGGSRPTVPVKTAGEVPKPMVLLCVRALQGITLNAPVRAGDVVVQNLLNTGVDIIAVADVENKIQ